MHPAPSIILFTTVSGAGYGLLFLWGLGVLAGLVPVARWPGAAGLGLALGLVTLGLLASTAHLRHPERAWRAISQWRSSWLSREGLAALLTYLPALGLAWGWVVEARTDGIFAAAAALAALGAGATVWCTGMIYASLAPIREWHRPEVPWLYLAFALMTGALLGHALLAGFGLPRLGIGVLAVLTSLVVPGLKLAYWRRIDADRGGPTPESATGLGKIGLVRMVDPPHTQTNYLLSEMGYRVARKHARKLRRLALTLWLAGAALPGALALAVDRPLAIALTLLAAAAGLAGVAIERWLFFAEATHTVTLYYGRRAA